MSKKKLVIKQDLCINCGTCVLIASDTFNFQGDIVKVINQEIDDETVDLAINSCPIQVIEWKEDE